MHLTYNMFIEELFFQPEEAFKKEMIKRSNPMRDQDEGDSTFTLDNSNKRLVWPSLIKFEDQVVHYQIKKSQGIAEVMNTWYSFNWKFNLYRKQNKLE